MKDMNGFVDIDLEKFFDNVPQDKLMSLVHNIINDGDTESLNRSTILHPTHMNFATEAIQPVPKKCLLQS